MLPLLIIGLLELGCDKNQDDCSSASTSLYVVLHT